jgi:predicted NAD/FAD-binding protein
MRKSKTTIRTVMNGKNWEVQRTSQSLSCSLRLEQPVDAIQQRQDAVQGATVIEQAGDSA